MQCPIAACSGVQLGSPGAGTADIVCPACELGAGVGDVLGAGCLAGCAVFAGVQWPIAACSGGHKGPLAGAGGSAGGTV